MEILIVKCSDLYYIQEPDADEEFNTITCVVAGTVIDEDKDNITIASMYFPKDQTARNVITIPKSVIYYKKVVKLPAKIKEE